MTTENNTPESDLDAALDALARSADPEADAVVEDALEIDQPTEADAAATAIAESTADGEAAADADADSEDPYAAFKRELRI